MVVQRWPAVPAAAKTIPRAASSRSADGATTRRCCRRARAGCGRGERRRAAPTWAPIRSEPVALTSATSGLSTSACAAVASADHEPMEVRAARRISAPARSSRAAHGQRRQRGQRRRLPDDGVAADQRDRGVPGPHGGGEVERGDHADRRRADATSPSGGGRGARTASCGRRAGARVRPRSRRCRSSPGPRPGPRTGSCRPRS